MKILQLIQKPQLRGAELFASQLSNHLVANGHEVILVCLTEGTAVLPFKGTIHYLNRPLNRRMVDVSGWKQLATLISEFNPDVLQANAGDTLKFAVFSKLFFQWRTPIIYRNANKVSDFLDSTLKKYFNRFLAGKVSHIISVSELCRLDFMKAYGIGGDMVTTVPIGIDLNQPGGSVPDDLKAFFSDGRVLVNVASLVPEKNHAGLLRIVRKLTDWGENIKLVVAGDGRLMSELQQLVVELKLEKQVLFTGYRTDVLAMVAHADAFVLPSLIEGLPGVILEAMHCRTPVIAYDVGGISEVVKPGVTGWLVKAGEEDAFVRSVQEVLASDDHEIIKENAYQQVVNEFDNKVIARRFLEVYNTLLGIRI